MSYKVKIHFFILSVVILSSCDTPSTQEQDWTASVALNKSEPLALPLDSTSIQTSENFQFFVDGKDFLAFFNKPDNSIKLYDLESRNLVKSIPLKTQGPNALIDMDSSPNNFKFLSQDSILIHSIIQEKVFLINSEGVIKDSWEIKLQSLGQKYPIVDLMTLAQLQLTDKHIVLTGRMPWYEDGKPQIIAIDKSKNNDPVFLSEKESLYKQFSLSEVGNWNFFKASNTQLNDQTILVSYPLSHKILIIKKDLKISTKELVNTDLSSLRPFGKEMSPKNSNSRSYFDYQGTAPVYHGILVDKYRKLIYRIARLEFPMSEVRKIRNGAERKSWDFSIMIYDYDFKPLGRKKLENTIGLDMFSMFVSKQGLHIRRKDSPEDLLTFDSYVVTDL